MDSKELKQFMYRVNNYHSTIKFTYNHHNQEIPFMDTTVQEQR